VVKNVQLTIIGRVQGVGFRYTALHKAREYNIKGYVRNDYDGSVFIEAEGEETDLDYFIIWCRRGPSASRVDNVIQVSGTVKNYTSFTIKH
jgi:acylphosphatase